MIATLFIRYLKGIGHGKGFGVQSPFAYEFVRMLRYGKRRMDNLTVEETIIKKITDYFYDDVIVMSVSDTERYHWDKSEKDVIIVTGIYDDDDSLDRWKRICISPTVRMTFDLRYVGVVVNRRGLYKNDYIINY